MGRQVAADGALRTGLVTHVHPARPAAQGDRVRRGDRPPSLLGRRSAKRLCKLGLGGDTPAPYARELDAFALAFTTPDQREGMAAFIEKRRARFAGREEVSAR